MLHDGVIICLLIILILRTTFVLFEKLSVSVEISSSLDFLYLLYLLCMPTCFKCNRKVSIIHIYASQIT